MMTAYDVKTNGHAHNGGVLRPELSASMPCLLEANALLDRGWLTGPVPMADALPLTPTAEAQHLFASLERYFPRPETRREGAELERYRGFVLGITSAVAGEGKTATTADLLLAACANTERSICLVDLGLGNNELYHRLIDGGGANGCEEDGVLRVRTPEIPGGEFTFLPGGPVPENPGRMARSPLIGEMIEATARTFDLVLVDLPAVSSCNAHPIGKHLDGVLMVVRTGVTPRHVVREAISYFGPHQVLGVVLNQARRR